MNKFAAWCKRAWHRIPTDSLYRWWKSVPKAVRVPLVLIVGSTVIVTGLAMIVLPGPGWAAIFLGLAILASEFAVVERVRDWLIGQIKRGYHWGRRKLKNKQNSPKA